MTEYLTHPIVNGAMAGFVSAALIDVAAFRKWSNVDEALAYQWKIALWRWAQGFVYGGLTAAGLGAI